MSDFLTFVKDQHQHLPLIPTPSSCKDTTYIITGANTGLGYQAAKHLVNLSCKRVILGVRSLAKGEAAKATIEAETGRKGIAEVWHLDLASYASVKAFAERVKGLDRVDGIIENASLALAKFERAEGMEMSLTVNNISTMLLAVLVLPKLSESAERFGIVPRLTVVGSGVAMEAKGELEKIEGDILDGLNRDMMWKRYQTTKLIQLYSVRQLASIHPASDTGVVINYVNPGLCQTELSRNAWFAMWLFIAIMKLLFARTAEEGSRTLLHGVTAGKESHGKFLSECEIREFRIARWITNDAGQKMQKRVWESLSK
ncbi:hypothetical protein FQN50_001975 [Emmonsiellopsis sp. PD_5]|nr:hypothetical protein FQN50_001975 [Emmonsiellopsis sp. PD_5]